MALRRKLTLPLLHASFALTGILHAIGGALLPALALSLGLSDNRSGALFFCYYLGTAIGALASVGRYVPRMAGGFAVAAAICCAIAWGEPALLPGLFLALGVGVGLPMTTVSMYAGRIFAGNTAAPLALLNFTWSAGALMAPLAATRILASHSWRAVYALLALLSGLAAVACWIWLPEPPAEAETQVRTEPTVSFAARYSVVTLFAVLTFLEVGIENTTATWLASYAMRAAGTGVAMAAAFSSLYWGGFLISRGLSSVLLLRLKPARMLWAMAALALIASLALVSFASAAHAAMVVLGLALAPIFPLLLSCFFDRTARVSDSRWVLAICGFGGSVLPWVTGVISSSVGSLRIGLYVVPVALASFLALLPFIGARRKRGELPNG